MNENADREVVQLWWTAEKYFRMATEVRNDLSGNILLTTVKQLTEKCDKMSKIKDDTAKLMKLNAHLASCAVRLSSIDEKRRARSPKRWGTYRRLTRQGKRPRACLSRIFKRFSKCRRSELTIAKVEDNLNRIVHFLLRHSIAHEEYLSTNPAHQTMQDALTTFKIGQLYENMQLVRNEIKNEIWDEINS